jgi:hypothetical protein
MKKYVKCFSNGTEAINWEAQNCDRCNNTGCYPKRAVQTGYITGHITWKIARFIGFKSSNCSSSDMTIDDCCTLNNRCNSFNKPIIPKRKDIVINDELKLF